MNQDFKPEYEASLQAYINARANTDILLGTAQTANENNASTILTEFEDLQSLENSARDRWAAARDSYLQ